MTDPALNALAVTWLLVGFLVMLGIFAVLLASVMMTIIC